MWGQRKPVRISGTGPEVGSSPEGTGATVVAKGNPHNQTYFVTHFLFLPHTNPFSEYRTMAKQRKHKMRSFSEIWGRTAHEEATVKGRAPSDRRKQGRPLGKNPVRLRKEQLALAYVRQLWLLGLSSPAICAKLEERYGNPVPVWVLNEYLFDQLGAPRSGSES